MRHRTYRTFKNKYNEIKTVTRKGLQSIDDKPSLIRETDKIIVKQWHSKNDLHRRNGPAVIVYHKEINDETYQWWLRGNIYSFSDFLKYSEIDHETKCELILNYG